MLVILFYHVFSFLLLTIDLHCLITPVIAQSFVATAEPAIPTEILNREAKAEFQTHLITREDKFN